MMVVEEEQHKLMRMVEESTLIISSTHGPNKLEDRSSSSRVGQQVVRAVGSRGGHQCCRHSLVAHDLLLLCTDLVKTRCLWGC